MKKKIILWLLFAIGFVIFGIFLSAPPYSFNKKYVLEVYNKDFLYELNLFKRNHPQYLSQDTNLIKEDGELVGGYYSYNFHFPNEKVTIHTVIISYENLNPKFYEAHIILVSFTGINGSNKYVKYEDLDSDEQEKLVKLFEKRIINPLEKQLDSMTYE